MIEETQVTPDTSEQETPEVETPEVETTEPTDEVDYQAEAKKAQELAENYKKRAEKAERKAKEAKAEPEAPTAKVELSNLDILAIAKSDVHEEDIERVTKFAQMEGISVKDALAHDDMKAILDRRAESRKSAAASNTNSNKGSRADASGETLAANASADNMPDVEDLEKMWRAG